MHHRQRALGCRPWKCVGFQMIVRFDAVAGNLKTQLSAPETRSLIYECRCDERLKTKAEEFTRLAYTGLLGGLEHLKIETRLINEKIANASSEYVT
jgi:hypothetical protein